MQCHDHKAAFAFKPNGNCNSCASSFICTCLAEGSVFNGEVRVNGNLKTAGGYLQVDTTAGAPAAADCDATAERGRMKLDPASNTLYVCANSGWVTK